MNKTFFKFLTAIASAMAMVSCANQPAPADENKAMDLFVEALNKSNLTLDTDGDITTLFYSDNAFFYDFSQAYETEVGKVDTGYVGTSQGIFNYVLDENGNVKLGRCESVTTLAPVASFMVYPKDLVSDLSLWVKNEDNDNVYTTTDTSLIQKITSLSGDSDYYYYVRSATLTFPEANTIEHAKITYTLSDILVTMDFYDFGKTESDFMTRFLANPTTVTNPTDYPAEMKADMNRILHAELPAYPFSFSFEYDSSLQTIKDYGCGNKTSEMDAALKEVGYGRDKNNSKVALDSKGDVGFIDNLYFQRIFEDGKLVAIEYIEVGWTSGYYMDDWYGTAGECELMYPEGLFSITFVSNDYYNEARFNSFMGDLMNQYGGFGDVVPFHMSEATYFKGTNYKEYASTLGCYEYLTFETVYDDIDAVKPDLQNYIDALLEADYLRYSGETLGKEQIELFKNNDTYAINISIQFEEGEDTFTIVVFVTDKVVAGEGISWAQAKAKLFAAHLAYPELPELPAGMKELEEVSYTDLIEIQRPMMVGITATAVYVADFFGFQYANAAEALENAQILSEELSKTCTKSETFSFKEDDTEYFIYEGPDYTVEATIAIEGATVAYLYKVYTPIKGDSK